MSEIFNFFKDILNMDAKDTTPIGLCGFEGASSQKKKKLIKPKRKQEMRLSELMGN